MYTGSWHFEWVCGSCQQNQEEECEICPECGKVNGSWKKVAARQHYDDSFLATLGLRKRRSYTETKDI